MSEGLIEKIGEMLAPILESESLSIYDMELIRSGNKSVLRIFIDRKGGVGLEHCETVSRYLSALLDVEDVIPGSFTLEVSSPGITRKLKKPEHFEKSIGSLVKITFKKQFAGPSSIKGILERASEGRFKVIPDTGGDAVEFQFDDVAKARLELDI